MRSESLLIHYVNSLSSKKNNNNDNHSNYNGYKMMIKILLLKEDLAIAG